MRWSDLLSVSVILPALLGLAGVALSLRTSSLRRPEMRRWFLLFVGLTAITVFSGARDAAENRQLQQRLLLGTAYHCKIPQARASRAHISVGNANVTLSPQHRTLPMWPFEISMSPEHALVINGELRDSSGIVAAELRDSTVVLRSPSYDCNSDVRALEIVDSMQRPVFRLVRDDSVGWEGPEGFRGFLRMTYQTYPALDSAQVCTDTECRFGLPSEILRLTAGWQPLFQYPSYETPGLRAASVPTATPRHHLGQTE